MTVHCPMCGKMDIREKNVAFADLPVLEWDWEDGELRPVDYDTDVSADWEAEDTPDQYVCFDCRWEGSPSALTVKED